MFFRCSRFSIAAAFSCILFASVQLFGPAAHAQSGWSVSGTINPATVSAGATVSIIRYRTTIATTTVDASGNFSFTGIANGRYRVRPAKNGITFNPTSIRIRVNSANVTGVNFTASGGTTQTYSISGSISGGAGATVSLSGAVSGTVTADSNGNYTFSGLSNGTYTVTPSKSGFTFSPASQSVTVNGANVTGVNFSATSQTWSLSGTITGGAGATVSLSGAASRTVTADASGNFTFTGLANGTYSVTPSKSGFIFSPSSQSVTMNGANVTGVNFVATAQTWRISGTISPAVGGAGVTVTLSGGKNATTTSDANGAYSFTGLANGSYTVTPTMSGYSYTPPSQTVSVNGANLTSINFTASAASSGHSVDLSWTASTTSTVSGYNVYRSSVSGGPYAVISSAPVTSTVYTDLSVVAGSTYYYVVTAVDSSGTESTYSNQATAVIPSP